MPQAVKMVVTGPFSSGKTQFIQSISEIDVVATERKITSDVEKIKNATTVAMDFGRITIAESLILYLFGTPGQDRFGFMWDDLATGALGAVVLIDTRRIEDAFPAIDYFERLGMPFVVALNQFDPAQQHPLDEVRDALDIAPYVPVVDCDARSKESVKRIVLTLLEVVLQRAMTKAGR